MPGAQAASKAVRSLKKDHLSCLKSNSPASPQRFKPNVTQTHRASQGNKETIACRYLLQLLF